MSPNVGLAQLFVEIKDVVRQSVKEIVHITRCMMMAGMETMAGMAHTNTEMKNMNTEMKNVDTKLAHTDMKMETMNTKIANLQANMEAKFEAANNEVRGTRMSLNEMKDGFDHVKEVVLQKI